MLSSTPWTRRCADGEPPTTPIATAGGRGPGHRARRCSGATPSRRCSSCPSPGRRAWQLRTTDLPEIALDELIPADHRRDAPPELAEVSERDLVGHFTRLSHRQFSVDLGPTRWAPAP